MKNIFQRQHTPNEVIQLLDKSNTVTRLKEA